MSTPTKPRRWEENFLTKNGWFWIAWDETQTQQLGRYFFKFRAMMALHAYARYLDKDSDVLD